MMSMTNLFSVRNDVDNTSAISVKILVKILHNMNNNNSSHLYYNHHLWVKHNTLIIILDTSVF